MSNNPSHALAPEVIPSQLSLRAYFVAHAPDVPNWFEPEMPEPNWPKDFHPASDMAQLTKKAVSEGWTLEHAKNVTGSWLEEDRHHLLSYLQQHLLAHEQDIQNNKNSHIERQLQWPLYWADTMIERLNK
jgi:hypothetical protein